jgi:CubicO group peptidase (beta-lactamase class C family)
VWAVGIRGGGTAGLLDPAEPVQPMITGTVFDLASLAKIVAVWAVIGALREAGTST